MRCTKHQINDIRMSADNLRKRLDCMLNPLPWTDQPKSEQHLTALHPKLPLAKFRFYKVEIRDAVRDDVHFVIRDPVGFIQDLASFTGHHDETTTARQQGIHHPALRIIGITKDRMKRRHHRHPNLLEQGK